MELRVVLIIVGKNKKESEEEAVKKNRKYQGMIPVGFDFGSSGLKFQSGNRRVYQATPTAVGSTSVVHTGVLGLRSGKGAQLVRFKDKSFWVGENAHDYGKPVENFDYDKLLSGNEAMAPFYAGISQYADLLDSPVLLSVGMPLETMRGDEALATKKALQKFLVGKHSAQVGKSEISFEVGDIIVAPQPVGGLMDYDRKLDGSRYPQRRKFTDGVVLSLSLGFNTLEIMAFRGMAAIPNMTKGVEIGIRHLLGMSNTNSFSYGELNRQLRSGELDTSAAQDEYESIITGHISDVIDLGNLSKALALGGGSILLKKKLSKVFGEKLHAMKDDEKMFSIAAGLYKVAAGMV